MRTVEAGDDYGALREVLERRLTRANEKNWELPDLMVIDGGRAQLQVALHAVSRAIHADTTRMTIISLAKQHGADGPPERVFLAGRKDPITLTPGAREWSLLIRLRDEAHRFANRARLQRSEKKYASQLSGIPGLGPRRIARLAQDERIQATMRTMMTVMEEGRYLATVSLISWARSSVLMPNFST